MKLYLAAPWVDRELMPAISAKFEADGHTITWKWWETEILGPKAENNNMDGLLRKAALQDFEGVKNCEVLILFNTKKSEGKAVEQGIALADGKPILAIGKRGDGTSMNVFHYMTNYKWVLNVDQAISSLRGYIPCQLT